MIIEENKSLVPYNTFGIEASARYFVAIKSEAELIHLYRNLRSAYHPIYILGGGSNVLFAGDYPGLVVHNQISGFQCIYENDEYAYVQAGGGSSWHELVLFALHHEWGGIENLSLIPGTCGAAPMQNIGAYGVELTEVFESLCAFDVEKLQFHLFSHADCDFGYRSSIFKTQLKGKFLITSIILRLTKRHQINTSYGAIQSELEKRKVRDPGIREVSDAVIAIRQSKLPDPATLGNAGSFFKNPVIPKDQFEQLKHKYPELVGYPLEKDQVKVAAGWLIDQAGWKGKRQGSVGVHEQQALVLVNYGGGTGKDILDLARAIQQDIQMKFGIALEPEVNVVLAEGSA